MIGNFMSISLLNKYSYIHNKAGWRYNTNNLRNTKAILASDMEATKILPSSILVFSFVFVIHFQEIFSYEFQILALTSSFVVSAAVKRAWALFVSLI